MSDYKFFQNRECEFFPCHKNGESENFNCMFCFCPLYALGEDCGGNFRYTASGIKDCSDCLFPHRAENHGLVCEKLGEVIARTKKKPENP